MGGGNDQIESDVEYHYLSDEQKYPRDWAALQEALRLYNAMDVQCYSAATSHLLDFCTRCDEDAFQAAAGHWRRLLVHATYSECGDESTFFKKFGLGVVKAYLECSVTFEEDRLCAVTEVGIAVVESFKDG